MEVLSVKETFDILDEKVKTEKQLAYLRFGDGRILMIDKKRGWKGDKGDHLYHPKLQEELIKSFCLKDENYLVSVGCGYKEEKGMRPGTFGKFKNDEELQEIVQRISNRKRYYNFIALHYLVLFSPLRVINFIKGFRGRRILLVGGGHLREAACYLKSDFVETPSVNAYLEFERIYNEIIEKGPEIVILGAGMCSAVLQRQLFLTGYEMITLDFGSLLDAMLEIKSRQWIRDNSDKIKRFRQLCDSQLL